MVIEINKIINKKTRLMLFYTHWLTKKCMPIKTSRTIFEFEFNSIVYSKFDIRQQLINTFRIVER